MILPSQLAAATAILGHVQRAADWVDITPEDKRGGPLSAGCRKQVGKLLDFDETYIPSAWLDELPGFDVAAMVDRLVTDCPEIDIPDHMIDRVEIVWKRKAGASMGAVVLGTCKPVSKREREAWRGDGKAPWWRLTLSLDVWIALTSEQRWRIVHHELMHATYKGDSEQPRSPAGRSHDTEEFAATVARYGLSGVTPEQGQFIAQAMARPNIEKELRIYAVDPKTGQGLLFGTDLTPVGW